MNTPASAVVPSREAVDVLHVLRNPHGFSNDEVRTYRLRAADELERLRAEVERTDAELIKCIGIAADALDKTMGGTPSEFVTALAAERDTLLAEVERLDDRSCELASENINLANRINNLRAEVERLRGELVSEVDAHGKTVMQLATALNGLPCGHPAVKLPTRK